MFAGCCLLPVPLLLPSLLACCGCKTACIRVLISSRGEVHSTATVLAKAPAYNGAAAPKLSAHSACKKSYRGRYMPTIGTAISSETSVPRHRTRAPSCLTILRMPSMVEPYTGQSTPHLAADVPGLTMRGHASGQPAIAHLLHNDTHCQHWSVPAKTASAAQMQRHRLTLARDAKMAAYNA